MSNINAMHIRILLIDDHAMLRKGLVLLLEQNEGFTIVGEAGDGEAGLALVAQLRPDVVVMDISMPGLNGIVATQKILEKYPQTKIIALSIHSEKKFVEEMLHAGAAGYILKESVPEDLVRGIKAVVSGEGYLSPAITNFVVSKYRDSLPEKQMFLQSEHQIITSKLHPPAVSRKHVHRPRLYAQLDENRTMPLQIITAPAGYGKSSLASSWLTNLDWTSSWLSLDETDNDLRRFLCYLIHAIQALFPKSLYTIDTYLQSPTLPPMQILASSFIAGIDDIGLDFTLVLDDFHLIKEKVIHDMLSQILRHPPSNMHLVLLGRTDPFLPIAEFRAKGKIHEIRLKELKFTEQETGEFLQKVLEHDFTAEQIKDWTKRTEGWVTGLYLAALSLKNNDNGSSFLDSLKNDSHYVMDYLFSEVLAKQDPTTRQYLLRSSILNRFSGPLCDAVCTSDHEPATRSISGWDFVHTLQNEDMFLINLDETKIWFRYHHLFQTLLQTELARQYSPEDICLLHNRASCWLADNGFVEEAIRHAIVAGNMENAITMVAQNRQTVLNQDQWFVVEKWLSLFPNEVIYQHAELLVAKMWVHYHHFDIVTIPSIIEIVAPQLTDSHEHQPLHGEVDFFRGYIAYFQNNGMKSLHYLNESSKHVPESYLEVRGQIEILYGLATQMLGKSGEAITRLNNLLLRTLNDTSIRKTRLLATPVYIHIISGNLPDALLANQQLHHFSVKQHYPYARIWSIYLHGLVCFYQNKLDEAADYFQEAVDNKYILHTRASVDSMIGLALVSQAMGKTEKVDRVIENLVDFVTPLSDPLYLEVARSGHARIACMRGQPGKEVQWSSAVENMVWWLESPTISNCRIRIAQGTDDSLEEARTILHEALAWSKASHNLCHQLEIKILLAQVCKLRNQNGEALAFLKEAVILAKPGGWFWPFIEPGRDIADLLMGLMTDDSENEYVRQILACCAGKERNAVSATPSKKESLTLALIQKNLNLVDPFTNREVEILLLLEQRYSNKEIGEELYIGIETVKSHLKSIYSKLNVNKRKEAVIAAQRIGLFGQI